MELMYQLVKYLFHILHKIFPINKNYSKKHHKIQLYKNHNVKANDKMT